MTKVNYIWALIDLKKKLTSIGVITGPNGPWVWLTWPEVGVFLQKFLHMPLLWMFLSQKLHFNPFTGVASVPEPFILIPAGYGQFHK